MKDTNITGLRYDSPLLAEEQTSNQLIFNFGIGEAGTPGPMRAPGLQASGS